MLRLLSQIICFAAAMNLWACGNKNENPPPAPNVAMQPTPAHPAATPRPATQPVAAVPQAVPVATAQTLNKGGAPWLSFTPIGTEWQATADGLTVVFKKSGLTYEVISGGKTYRTKLDGEKIKVVDASGAPILKLKKRPDKTKVYQTAEDTAPWSLKPKDGRIKIKKGETDMGKIKLKLEKQLIEVRNTAEQAVCTMTTTALTPAAAVCLMDNLTAEQQLIAFGMLSLI